jgi:hypothetical protein
MGLRKNEQVSYGLDFSLNYSKNDGNIIHGIPRETLKSKMF